MPPFICESHAVKTDEFWGRKTLRWRPHPDHPELLTCAYCGSMTCEDFVAALHGGGRVEVADWKYGYPHKVYLDLPNPHPNKLHEIGWSNAEQKPNGEGWERVRYPFWHRRKPGERRWRLKGLRPTIHAKFYFVHLTGWPKLEGEADEICKATGILFENDSRGLRWRASPAATHRGTRF